MTDRHLLTGVRSNILPVDWIFVTVYFNEWQFYVHPVYFLIHIQPENDIYVQLI